MTKTLFIMFVDVENEKLILQVYVERLSLDYQDLYVALVKH